MNQPTLWSALVCAFFIHLLILGGLSVYATRGINLRMPEVYRVTIVSAPPASGVVNQKKTGPSSSPGTSKPKEKSKPRSLKKGVTMLKRIEKIKKTKAKKRKELIQSKKAYEEEKALEEALERIHKDKIARIKQRVQLKKSVLSTIESLPSRTGRPASRDVQNYAALVREMIRAEWVFPSALAQEVLSVEVRFRVKANGEATAISIMKPSGNSLFDASVVKAIKKASPFPPPPPGGEDITVRFRTGGEGEG